MLADLTGSGLARLGLDGRIATGDCYPLAQRWSAWIHMHPKRVDGVCYFARNAPSERSVVLFDDRVGMPDDTELVESSSMSSAGVVSPLVRNLISKFQVAIIAE